MPAKVSVIGRSTRIHGRVTGVGDVEVQGFVEGEVAVSGDVTVDAHGMVGAGVRGRRLVVRGAVKGDLVGEEAVLLEEGARVVGDIRAPAGRDRLGSARPRLRRDGRSRTALRRRSLPGLRWPCGWRLRLPAAPKPAPAAVVPAATVAAGKASSTLPAT